MAKSPRSGSRAPEGDLLASVRKQLLEDIGKVLEHRLGGEAAQQLVTYEWTSEAKKRSRRTGTRHSGRSPSSGKTIPDEGAGPTLAPRIPIRASTAAPRDISPPERPTQPLSMNDTMLDRSCGAIASAWRGPREAARDPSGPAQTARSSLFGKFRKAVTAALFLHRLRNAAARKDPSRAELATHVGRRGSGESMTEEHQDNVSEASSFSNFSKLSVNPAWDQEPTASRSKRRRKTSDKAKGEHHWLASSSMSFCRMPTQSFSRQGRRRRSYFEKTFVFRPQSPCLMLWDVWTFLAIAYDVVQLPLAEAFQLESYFVDIVEVVTASTWMIDMLLSFVRGYVDSSVGSVEMRPRQIACHYLKTWFWLDAAIVTLDFFLLWMQQSEWLKFFTFLRWFRILRLVRVIRILKVTARLSSMMESLQLVNSNNSEKLSAVLMIVKQLLMLVVINHFIACGWYALGREVVDGWVVSHLALTTSRTPRDSFYLYTTAFHWSITQFTPASMEVSPSNAPERIFTICAIFTGLVMFSSFISSMTQSMTHLRQLSMQETMSSQRVRRYITENNISSDLASRVMGVIKMIKARKKPTRLKIRDMDIFAGLPFSLQVQLHEEVFAPVVCLHVVFGNFRAVDQSRFFRLCLEAISELDSPKDQEVFLPGNPGEFMYFIKSGKLEYYWAEEGSDEDQIIEVGRRIAEVSLWARWEHRGRLVPTTHSEMLRVRAQAFQDIALSSNAAQQLKDYAKYFVTKSSASCGSTQGVTDLWGSDTEVDDIAKRAFRRTKATNVEQLFFPGNPDIIMVQDCFRHWKEATVSAREPCCCCFQGCRSITSILEDSSYPRSGSDQDFDLEAVNGEDAGRSSMRAMRGSYLSGA